MIGGKYLFTYSYMREHVSSSMNNAVNAVNGGIALIHEIVTSVIIVSQVCCDALLSLGDYEESIDLYRLNLKLQQYLHDETSIKADLVDQDIKSRY